MKFLSTNYYAFNFNGIKYRLLDNTNCTVLKESEKYGPHIWEMLDSYGTIEKVDIKFQELLGKRRRVRRFI